MSATPSASSSWLARLPRFPRLARLVGEVLFFVLTWWLADGLVQRLHWPVPGGVVGLVVVTALLLSGLLRPKLIEGGARWLLGEMLLFFVPPLMAVVSHHELMGWLGAKLVVVIVVGTLFVMGGVGWVVNRVIRLEDRWAQTGR